MGGPDTKGLNIEKTQKIWKVKSRSLLKLRDLKSSL